jgi:hypothetical protein
MSSTSLPREYRGLVRLPLNAGPFDLPDPPAALVPDAFAGRLYDMLEPLAQQDPAAGWSLLILCNAIGVPFELVEDWVRDTPDGPGWSLLMDVARCPDEALPWLGQFAGVRVLPGSSSDEQRARIASTDGFKRGTVAAMVGAAKATLTGPQRLIFRERDGAAHGIAGAPDYAYVLTVHSWATETPNPTATLNALLAQKPGGIVLYYSAQTMQDYAAVKAAWATYALVKSHHRDYAALSMDDHT